MAVDYDNVWPENMAQVSVSGVNLHKAPDEYLDNGFVSSIEYYEELFSSEYVDSDGNGLKDMIPGMAVQAAIMGSIPNHPYVLDCLAWYNQKVFDVNSLSDPDEMLAPHTYAYIARKYGYKYINKEQILSDDIHIYSSDIFAADPYKITDKTIMVHMCNGSWRNMSKYQKLRLNISKWKQVLL